MSPKTTCPRHRGHLREVPLAALCGLTLALSSAVRADQIVVAGANHVGARVIGLERGQLRFRSADGLLHTVWLNEIDLLIVDRGSAYADFNQAEQFLAGGEPQRALARYRRTLKLVEAFWPDLIAARLALACDAAHQLDQAVRNFIRVLRGRYAGPPAAARLIPRFIPERRDGKVVRALEQLDAARAKASEDLQQVLLDLARYEILRRTGDQRAEAAARKVATRLIPADARSRRTYGIQLEALQAAMKEHVEPALLSSLDQAMRHCPRALLPGFLLLKGRALARTASTREDRIRAALPLMRVAIHFPDDARAAEGLYGTARLLEAVGRTDQAVELLKEAGRHKRIKPEARKLVESALQRLQPTERATPRSREVHAP